MQQHAGTRGAPKRLSKRTLLFYSLPNISISVAQLPIGIYLNDLYTTALGVSLGLVGIAIFVSRLTDVVTDPIIGSLSDNWQTRFGRRKLWVFLGTPLMIASLWFLFVPPQGADVWWLFVMISLFYLANTMIDLPYRAWGADLSTDYGERSHVTGWREAFGFIGNLVVFAVPIYMIFALGQTKITDWTWGIALVTAISLPVFVLLALIFVPEPPRERVQREPVKWLAGLRIVSGLMFMQHGTQKIFGFPAPARGPFELFSQMGVGGVLELVGGAMIVLGLFTRFAALMLAITMAVAFFMVHKAALSGANPGELALIYLVGFLTLVFAGAGKFSADKA